MSLLSPHHILWVSLALLQLGSLSLVAQTGKLYSMRTGFPLSALNNVDARDAQVAAKHLLKEIVESHGIEYDTEVIEDNDEFLQKLVANEFDFFLIFGYEYLRLNEEYPMRPVLIGQDTENSIFDEYLFLVPHHIDSLSGFSDAKLLIQRGSGDLPLMWLQEKFAEEQIPFTEMTFTEVQETNNVSQAVLPLFFGKAQACIVTKSAYETVVELNPQIGKKLKVLYQSEPYINSILCFRADYKEKEPDLVLREGLKLNKKPKGEQLLTLFRVKRLYPFDPAQLDSLKSLLARREERSQHAQPLSAEIPIDSQEP